MCRKLNLIIIFILWVIPTVEAHEEEKAEVISTFASQQHFVQVQNAKFSGILPETNEDYELTISLKEESLEIETIAFKAFEKTLELKNPEFPFIPFVDLTTFKFEIFNRDPDYKDEGWIYLWTFKYGDPVEHCYETAKRDEIRVDPRSVIFLGFGFSDGLSWDQYELADDCDYETVDRGHIPIE